jgi:hypothetical protein
MVGAIAVSLPQRGHEQTVIDRHANVVIPLLSSPDPIITLMAFLLCLWRKYFRKITFVDNVYKFIWLLPCFWKVLIS